MKVHQGCTCAHGKIKTVILASSLTIYMIKNLNRFCLPQLLTVDFVTTDQIYLSRLSLNILLTVGVGWSPPCALANTSTCHN